ncbi:unnamed protein product [Fusarium graminearum]|nr:unnamed protein product [Fusarium graminearum]
MKYWPLLLFAFATTHGAADDLSDFSNNLATDVGPLLVLFGESMTRQYLSESTSFLDYFIFAMAPIGIITAIVSTIRVCGHSTLRAFIGRSQEGDGVVEAELCTSTSRDVCELFNKGGITRVLGRPQILELIYIYNPDQSDELQIFCHYLEDLKDPETSEWTRVQRHASDGSFSTHTQFAPKPNLSLNVGIRSRPDWVFVLIAILGCLLQGGVVALAGVGVWILGWNLSDSRSSDSTNYAPIMFITGTIVMCGGMFWCAALIGQTTHEIRYSRKSGTPRSRLLWLQPGRQVIGDQTFDAFAHLENTKNEPLRVWTSSRKDFDERFEIYTFIAVASVLLGYICQFIGLRGMKAWVSLAQLGITIIMSTLRGLVRVQRLERDTNKLSKVPDMVAGYELDWLTFELALRRPLGNASFCITGQHNAISSPESGLPCNSQAANSQDDQIDFGRVLHIRQRLSHLTGHNPTHLNNKKVQEWKATQVKAREPAQILAAAICSVAERLIRKKVTKDKIVVQIEISARQIDNKPHRQMVDIALTPPSGSQTKWSVDSSLLEAILGLSMWSLVSANVLHDTDQTGNTISLSEDIKWGRIVHDRTQAQKTYLADKSKYNQPLIDVSIWFGPDAGRLVHDRVLTKQNHYYGPMNLEGNPKIPSHWHQLCGWNTVHESLQNRLVPDPSNNNENHDTAFLVVLAPTEDLLPQICAQDLFLAILSPLVDTLVTGETAILESGGHVLLQNSTANTISDILVESGLATRFEALSCAVSLLATRLHPDQDTLLSDLRKTADTYRRNAEWGRAETLMQWACLKSLEADTTKPRVSLSSELLHNREDQLLGGDSTNCNELLTSDHTINRFTETLQATGELYRWSCAQSSNKERLEFGLQGIEWMLTNFNYLSTRSSDLTQILKNYGHVSSLMKDRASRDWLPQNVHKIKGTTEQHPLVEAIRNGDKKMSLWHLCFTDTRDFDRHQLRQALPLAARNGWTDVSYAILEMKGDVDSKDESGRTSISYWAEHGQLSLLQYFVGLGASVNTEDNQGRTPLIFAVKYKQEMAVNKLLHARLADHSKKDKEGMTALHWAIKNGLVGIMHLLLDLEARLEPNSRVEHASLVMEAAKTGEKAVLDGLLERNISVESRDALFNSRPLTRSVYKGDRTAVQILLMCNALVDTPDENMPRPNLSEAMENGDEEITRLLLARTDTLTTFPDIWTSLLNTIVSGYWTCAQLVLQKYVASRSISSMEPAMPALFTITPQKEVLDLLLKIHNTPEADDDSRHLSDVSSVDGSIVQLLIGKGAKPEVRNKYGQPALITAIGEGQREMITAMLTSRAFLECTDRMGRSALSYACEAGNGEIASLLLQSNVDMDLESTDTMGRNALSYACDKGDDNTVRLLLEKNAKTDSRDIRGRSALSYACQAGNEEITRLLLQRNVEIESTDTKGRNALSYACESGSDTTVRLLLQSNAKVELTGRESSPCWYAQRDNEAIRLLLSDAASSWDRAMMRVIWEAKDGSSTVFWPSSSILSAK